MACPGIPVAEHNRLAVLHHPSELDLPSVGNVLGTLLPRSIVVRLVEEPSLPVEQLDRSLAGQPALAVFVKHELLIHDRREQVERIHRVHDDACRASPDRLNPLHQRCVLAGVSRQLDAASWGIALRGLHVGEVEHIDVLHTSLNVVRWRTAVRTADHGGQLPEITLVQKVETGVPESLGIRIGTDVLVHEVVRVQHNQDIVPTVLRVLNNLVPLHVQGDVAKPSPVEPADPIVGLCFEGRLRKPIAVRRDDRRNASVTTERQEGDEYVEFRLLHC